MLNRLRWTAAAFVLLAPSLTSPQTAPAPAAGAAEGVPVALRPTPRSAVMNFLRATQARRYRVAAQFLQLSEAERDRRGAELARELSQVMDQLFIGNLDAISNSPDGALDDGLPPDREIVGHFATDGRHPLVLVRVPDRTGGHAWLIAAETLEQVPEMYAEVGYPEIERRLPAVLVEHQLLGVDLWRWLAAILLIPISAAAAWVLLRLFVLLPILIFARLRRAELKTSLWAEIRTPALVLATMLLHYLVLISFGIPLLYRQYYGRTVRISVTVAAAWLLWRWMKRGLKLAYDRVVQRGDVETGSILLLSQRITKVLVVAVAILISLSLLGIEMKGVLAGLGIGGIAVALAAQKTLENVFGGIWVLSDRAIRVGDFCVFGAHRGTVEDIGLRSTRVRTLERTVVTIPNGQLANMIVENFTLRDKFWFNPAITLRYETTPAQLEYVLKGVQSLLEAHPKIEKDTVRVRFQRLGNFSLDVEVHAYVLAGDFVEFTAVREELLVQIKEVVAASGADFAFPSQTLYLAKDPKTGQPQ
jgi:MscS family membrane protein